MNTRPTESGCATLDPFHRFAVAKRLRDKPVKTFEGDTVRTAGAACCQHAHAVRLQCQGRLQSARNLRLGGAHPVTASAPPPPQGPHQRCHLPCPLQFLRVHEAAAAGLIKMSMEVPHSRLQVRALSMGAAWARSRVAHAAVALPTLTTHRQQRCCVASAAGAPPTARHPGATPKAVCQPQRQRPGQRLEPVQAGGDDRSHRPQAAAPGMSPQRGNGAAHVTCAGAQVPWGTLM